MRTKSEALTDRYIAAAVASAPHNKRVEVERDLRDTIANSIAQRVGQGVDTYTAERDVLTELGDPMRVGAARSGRTLALIGPAFFPTYIRLLRLLLVIVVPIIGILAGIASALGGDPPVAVLASALGVGFNIGVQIAFWVTIVFAILDRRGSTPTWNIGDLPAAPNRRIGLGETLATTVGLSLLIWILLWLPGYQGTFDTDLPAIPILEPTLSSFWIPYLVIVLLASIALEIVKYRAGMWTVPLAAVNTVLNAAFAIPAIWLLASDHFFNPAFIDAVAIPGEGGLGFLSTFVAWLIAAVCAFDVAEGWWKSQRPGAKHDTVATRPPGC